MLRSNIIFCFILSIFFTSFISAQNYKSEPRFREPIYSGYRQNSILDLVLIYQGGHQRLDWTPEQMYPYVIHTNKYNKKDWFFDGFLFLEFHDGKKYSFQNSYKKEEYSGKEQWEWLIDRHFEEGKAIKALNDCIDRGINEIGKPSFKHKVVLGLPEPQQNWTGWGTLDGKKLDFTKREDRIKAAKWYIDQTIDKFTQSDLKNLELAGIYWINEQMITSDYITVEIGDYVREKGMQFYWIPYYMGVGFSEWYEYGFDMAYLQPTYFFNKKIPDDRVDNACRLAHTHNMGLEMEFDGKALINNPRNHRDRLIGYIESFVKNDVYKNAAIAYYEGGQGVYSFSKSQYWEDRLMMDTLHAFVKDRRVRMIENTLYQQKFDNQGENLSDAVWNINGNKRGIKSLKDGLNISSEGKSINLNTKGKIEFTYGRIELKVKISPKNKDSKIRVRMLPVNEKLGEWPKSGEILLMDFDKKKPEYFGMGLNTEQLNEVKGNMRRTISHFDIEDEKYLTIVCEWKKDRVLIYVNDELTYSHEDIFDKNDVNYPRFWHFDDDFYFDMNIESNSKNPALVIESIKISRGNNSN